VSCLHGDVAEYRRCLADFFAEGLQDGLRLAYVSSDGADAARPDLADLSDLDGLLAAGALHVLSARDRCGAGGPVDRLLLTLDAYGRRNRIAASLRSAPPFVARLMELLPVVSLQLAKSGAQE
jgi:hypothetical protein